MKLTVYYSNKICDKVIHYDTLLLVRGAIRTTLTTEKCRGDYEVSVTFCDDEYIRRLNNEFRNIDKSTDVLSFPLNEGGDLEDGALGDIVLSIEHAERQAKEFGHSTEREIAFLVAHSMLHLLGYDHEKSEGDDIDMRSRQRKIMERMGLTVKEGESAE